MAEWKKIITSGSNAELAQVTASVGFKGSGEDITDVKTSNLSGTITNAQLAGSIANAKLANDGITIAGADTSLGGTITSATILNNGKALVSGSLGPNATLIRGLTAATISGSISATSVTAAGALMDSELSEIATVKALTKAGISGSLGPNATLIRSLSAANISGSISATSVTAAGALMDSELSEIATVKALTKSSISGSLGGNATLIRSLTAASISGSFTAVSASIAEDIAAASGDITSVVAGDGLANGGTTGDVTLNVGAGTGITANDDDVAVSAAQTSITSVYNTGLIVGRAANDTTINFTVDDTITFDAHATAKMVINADGVTIPGNLTVNGTTTTITSTDVSVADKFMFLASGSTNTDGGIVVAHNANNSGSAFGYDESEERWAFQSGSAAEGMTALAPDAYAVAAVVNDNVAAHRKNGNIRVEGGEIFVYVE